jgi:hypothetical protein
MKVINISKVSEEVVLAKKTPKKNNDVDAASLSLSFKLGKENRIAVKRIDHRGNEVMVVREIG